MKITFIYPAIGLCGFNGDVVTYGGEVAWISHGLASVATHASKHGEVEIIDLRRLDSWDDFVDMLTVSDYFAISVSSLNYEPAKKCAELIRDKYGDAKIIVGGFDPSMFPEKYGWADIVIKGDGENKIVELMGGKPNGPMWINRELFRRYDLELSFPFTPCMEVPMVTMLAGRGCPYNCAYCQPAERNVHGHYSVRDVNDVLGELRFLKEKYDFKSVLFWDDTFAVNPDWVDKFCDGYKDIGGQLVINCRADIIANNPDMMEKLRSVGLHMVLVGVESGSQRILNLINKGVRVNENIKASMICRDLGVKMFATFMLGLPTETKMEALTTMTHINELKVSYMLPFYYTPIPGTTLYDFCKEKDLIINGCGQSIERTLKYNKSIKGVDYDFLDRYIEKATVFRREAES